MSDMIPPLISIVQPSYLRFADFALCAEHNEAYSSSLCEVVVSVDDSADWRNYVEYAERNADRMRIRVVVKPEPRSLGWQPPCRPINDGIIHSLAPFILVKSPETILLNQAEHVARMIKGQGRKSFFLTGDCVHINPNELRTGDACQRLYDEVPMGKPVCLPTKGNGLLIMRRSDALQIGGYDEQRTKYGRDDDCIRARLKEFGCEHVHADFLRAVHIWRETRPKDDGIYEPLRPLEEVRKQKWDATRARVIYDWARE